MLPSCISNTPPLPHSEYTYRLGVPVGRFIKTLVWGLVLSAIGVIKSEAQIIINVPLGQTLNYSSLANGNYVFRGAGRVNLNANNSAVTGSVTIEGAEVWLNAGQSTLSNVSSITINKGGRLVVDSFYYNYPYRRQLSPNANIYFDSGFLYIRNANIGSAEKIADLVVSGGTNRLEMIGLAGSDYTFTLLAEKLISSGNGTLHIQTSSGYEWHGVDPDFKVTRVRFNSLPARVNGIIPYSTIAIREFPLGGGSLDYFFSGVSNVSGQYEIVKATSQATGQSGWGSAALNVLVNANQTLTTNRALNSLRFIENRTVNLVGYTLSVNAGAFLTARAGRQQWIENGTLTTAQDRYFFHIYGTRLSVSSNISGAGKELIKSGPGELFLYGSQANTYTGTTYVHEGTLVLNKSPNAKAVGNIIVGDGGGTDTLRLDQSHQIDDLATVRLKGASRAKNMTAQGVLRFNGAGGIGLTEKIHTLEIEGQGVINFAGGTLVRPNVLETTRVLLPTADDTLFIRNWIEYEDYFLVTRALAPNAAELARIWFEGWAPGAKLRDYNASHWEIVPYGSPEPATYGAILGAVGLGLVVWRKRRLTASTHRSVKN